MNQLIPGLTKFGYESSTAQPTPPPLPSLLEDPLASLHPRHPYFNEYEPPRGGPHFSPPTLQPPYAPDDPSSLLYPNNGDLFSIGRSDLDPFASSSFNPANNNGGGMLMGPGHPLFLAQRGRGRGRGVGPPGSRFDPVSPFYGRQGFGPDNDELPPPGYMDMFM